MSEKMKDRQAMPRFLEAAELRAKTQGMSGEAVLRADEERVLASNYPRRDCLQPDQVQALVLGEGHDFTMERSVQQHLAACEDCRTVVAAAKPDPAEFERITSELARLTREAAIQRAAVSGPAEIAHP